MDTATRVLPCPRQRFSPTSRFSSPQPRASLLRNLALHCYLASLCRPVFCAHPLPTPTPAPAPAPARHARAHLKADHVGDALLARLGRPLKQARDIVLALMHVERASRAVWQPRVLSCVCMRWRARVWSAGTIAEQGGRESLCARDRGRERQRRTGREGARGSNSEGGRASERKEKERGPPTQR